VRGLPGGVLVLDGGLATELESRGAQLTGGLWSARALIEAPEEIEAVHRDYLAAGADVITTASYQATFPGFARAGLADDEARRLLGLSVELACAARDQAGPRPRSAPPITVAASIGPYAASLADGGEYRGDDGMPVAALIAFHAPRIEVLLSSAADVLAFETVPSLREAEAIVSLLERFPEARAWISFSARSATELADGSSLAEAIRLAQGARGCIATGVNCVPPERALELVQNAHAAVPGARLIAYPNSGETWSAGAWSGPRPEPSLDFGELAVRLEEAGASIIGGCCRTRPADIARIRARLAA
jgi:homocysteine S-methyltransferase